MAHFIVTGSSTASGQPLYLRGTTWQPAFAESSVLDTESEAKAAVATHRAESQAIVCDPYVIEVEVVDDVPRPTSLRESIRAEGPTVPYA